MAPEIPLDLMIDILTRLPAKSLMRFKCVSKLWSCLLRSRYFCNLYLTVASPHRSHRLYMSLNDDHPVEFCQNPDTSALLSLSSCFSNTAESFDQDLIVPGMGGCHMVVLRGLVLYVVCRKACIYNPTTRQSVTLPLPDFKSNLFRHEERIGYSFYFLGHDPVLDQYKVVCTDVTCSKYYGGLTSQHWVFVLEAGGSWERMEFEQPHVPTRRGICISGVIYYLASTPEVHNVVISFDVRSQVFNMIQGPDDLVSAYEFVGVIEYGGKPVIFDYTHLGKTGLVDLWVLEDGGKWSRESLVLQPSQMHLVDKKDIKLTVEGTTQNGEVILAVRPLIYPYYILYYDLQKNDMRKVTIRGIPDHWFGKLSTNVCFSFILINKNESIMYLET